MKVTEELLKKVGFKKSKKGLDSDYIITSKGKDILIRLNKKNGSASIYFESCPSVQIDSFEEIFGTIAEWYYDYGAIKKKIELIEKIKEL